MELGIGQLVHAFAVNKINSSIDYIGCVYYVGKKCYSFEISPLPDKQGNLIFPTIFSNADYLVPDELEGIENSYGSRFELRKLNVNLSLYTTQQKIMDIPSKNLSEFDWWKTIEDKVRQETEQTYYKNKYEKEE